MDIDFNIIKLSYQNLKKRIKKNEGFSQKPYKDQLGFLTIGYGHLILSGEKKLINNITKLKLERIFLEDFNKAIHSFNIFFRPFVGNKKDSELLIEMIFQMGVNKVLKFKRLLAYVVKRNKYMVCFEMMNSLWYKQTPNRVKKLIHIYLKK